MNDLIDLKPGSLGRGTLCEVANLDDDFIGSIGILSDARDIFSCLVEIGRLRFKPIQACVAMDCHCSKRLIDLMGDRCGHFSKGRHTHNVRELRARLISRFFFSLDLRRKVGRRSDRHHTDRRIRNPACDGVTSIVRMSLRSIRPMQPKPTKTMPRFVQKRAAMSTIACKRPERQFPTLWLCQL